MVEKVILKKCRKLPNVHIFGWILTSRLLFCIKKLPWTFDHFSVFSNKTYDVGCVLIGNWLSSHCSFCLCSFCSLSPEICKFFLYLSSFPSERGVLPMYFWHKRTKKFNNFKIKKMHNFTQFLNWLFFPRNLSDFIRWLTSTSEKSIFHKYH